MDRRTQRTEELDRLVSEAEAALRAWAGAGADDPGIALLEAWTQLADRLSHYAERMANEAYLGGARRRSLSVEVDGQLWRAVATLDGSKADDDHYTVTIREDGATVISFGDGVHGRRPPEGGSIRVRLRPAQRVASVQLAQGRVILDQDWNEPAGKAVCGVYRGIVVDAADPQGNRRLRVTLPEVTGGESRWAQACEPAGTTTELPSVGDSVWVAFEACDPARPIWLGRAVV